MNTQKTQPFENENDLPVDRQWIDSSTSRHARKRRNFLGALGLALCAAGGLAQAQGLPGDGTPGPLPGTIPGDPQTPAQPAESTERCREDGRCAGPDLPYVHPLQGNLLPDGRVPVLQVKDAAGGGRYAVEEGVEGTEEGQQFRAMGVVALPSARPSPLELDLRREEKIQSNGGELPDYSDQPEEKIGMGLRIAMQNTPPGELIDVLLRVARPAGTTLFEEMETVAARGEVTTQGEFRASRKERLETLRQRVQQAQQPVVDAIAANGGVIHSRMQHLYGLTARMPVERIGQIAEMGQVDRMDINGELIDAIDGQHMRRGTQIAQYINSGWDGENGAAPAITFAVVENGQVHDDHVGFREYSGSTSPRIRARYDCSSSSCSSTSNFTSPGSHATAVNGIAWGDLTDDQDSSWTVELDQKQRSGYAGEAWGYTYAVNYDMAAAREAFDHLIGRSYVSHAVNASFGSTSDDPACEGESSTSKDVNDMFEAGLLLIKSAGNEDHGSLSDCTVSSPGAAIGAFTVGSHGEDAFGTDYLDVETDPISSFSSRGGVSSSEGKNRTIVDVTAYGCREKLFDTSGGYSQAGCGTSYAAPTVTAAAINFVDFYKNHFSDLIDNPGILFANLLLMGDRESESGSISREYDELWGAGRMKMRKWDSEGLDAPYLYKTGYTCVDDGQTVTVSINSGATLSSDVDYLKAVIYWYDPRHEKGKSVSDIDLRLKTTGGTTLRKSLDYYDNKERVFYRNVGGQAVELEIEGWEVKTDTTSCGNNSMKVYYAVYYEDDDRDDADGPGSLIDPE